MADSREKSNPIGYDDFMRLSNHIYNLAGINLKPTPKNFALVHARIESLCRKLQSNLTFDDIINKIDRNDRGFIPLFISIMTTNTTNFFREQIHFTQLKEIAPEIINRKRKQGINEFRLWCAATSTGQEPYSLLIVILKEALISSLRLKMLATDIDNAVLLRAARGVYPVSALSEIPPHYATNMFDRKIIDGSEYLVVKKRIRDQIRFAEFNLVDENYPFQYKFDVVFCRNVLIYFDDKTKARVIDNIAGSLTEGGYLFLGLSESMIEENKKLKRVGPSMFQRVKD